eukprot:m.46913 g.46913  ORF g.46913 m.46913 type:complete len:54 (+) comp10427_c0_seq1:241-402(+)
MCSILRACVTSSTPTTTSIRLPKFVTTLRKTGTEQAYSVLEVNDSESSNRWSS